MQHDEPIEQIDIAIVGGGAAGLYAALRLVRDEAFEHKSIVIFDAYDRLGGRINTLKLPPSIMPYSADAGAMRYIPDKQVLINALIKALGLDSHTYPYVFPTASYFSRGRHFSTDVDQHTGHLVELYSAGRAPGPTPQTGYKITSSAQRGKQPGELIGYAISKLLGDPDLDILGDGVGISSVRHLKEQVKRASEAGLSISFEHLSPAEWHYFKMWARYAGTKLSDLGFWDLIQGQLEEESYQWVEDGLGYQTIIGTWNAADAIPWFLADFALGKKRVRSADGDDVEVNVQYASLHGGMSRLPEALRALFLKEAWAPAGAHGEDFHVRLYHWLTTIRCEDSGAFLLTFEERHQDLESHGYGHVLRPSPPRTRMVRAKQVILAMPPGAIREVALEGPALDSLDVAGFKSLLGTVTSHDLLKMFIVYSTPWWWDGNVDTESASLGSVSTPGGVTEFSGYRTFTSLPLRMLYYHGPQSQLHASAYGEVSNTLQPRMSMIMAYCDARHALYWDALKSKRDNHGAYTSPRLEAQIRTLRRANAEQHAEAQKILALYGVPEAFADRAHEQVWRLHEYRVNQNSFQPDQITPIGLRRRPVPGSEVILYMNWGRAPFYGGWHSWNVGEVSHIVRRKVAQPFTGLDLYICGEAFSSDQGWIEGALRSAELVLTNYMHMPPPKWLDNLQDLLTRARYDTLESYINW